MRRAVENINDLSRVLERWVVRKTKHGQPCKADSDTHHKGNQDSLGHEDHDNDVVLASQVFVDGLLKTKACQKGTRLPDTTSSRRTYPRRQLSTRLLDLMTHAVGSDDQIVKILVFEEAEQSSERIQRRFERKEGKHENERHFVVELDTRQKQEGLSGHLDNGVARRVIVDRCRDHGTERQLDGPIRILNGAADLSETQIPKKNREDAEDGSNDEGYQRLRRRFVVEVIAVRKDKRVVDITCFGC